ncbi:MAG: DUF4340 domain-containing protein [Candidatus Aminicenantes bacterium]
MKFRTTFYLLLAFIALLVFVLVIEFPGEKESRNLLVDLPPYDVEKIEFDTGESLIIITKQNQEEWMITSPVNAPADKIQTENLARDMSELAYEKTVETEPSDLAKYGIPSQKIILHYKDKPEPVGILIGDKNPLDNTYFAKLENESRVVLIPSRLSTTLEKSLSDFRKKDIFRFDTEKSMSITVSNPETSWQAEKKDGEWFLVDPLDSLADKTGIQGILDSLSSLKAEEFVSENKTDPEIRQFGLHQPSYRVEMNLPEENKKTEFFFNRHDDAVYATTNDSLKIVTVPDAILTKLDQSLTDLRDKSIAGFYTWEVSAVDITSRQLTLSAVKDQEETWRLDSAEGPEADIQKIEDFLRKISYLEASDFIDPPWDAGEYGLADKDKKVTITVKKDQEAETITLLIGKEDKENNQVVLKNQRFDYLYKAGSEFLQTFPLQRKDWLKNEITEEENAEVNRE